MKKIVFFLPHVKIILGLIHLSRIYRQIQQKNTADKRMGKKRIIWRSGNAEKPKAHPKSFCEWDSTDLGILCQCGPKVFNGNVPCDVCFLLNFKSELKVLEDSNTSPEKRWKSLHIIKEVTLLQQISRPISSWLKPWLFKKFFSHLKRTNSKNKQSLRSCSRVNVYRKMKTFN